MACKPSGGAAVSASIFRGIFVLKNTHVSFAPGIGYSCSNIYSRHGLWEDSTGTSFRPLQRSPNIALGNYKINKLTLQYVDIPLELRIRTNPDKFNNCWKFVVGFKAGIRVDAHTKQRTKIGNVVKVDVERRFPDFNLLRMGPTIRIGYSVVNVFALLGVYDILKKVKALKPTSLQLVFHSTGCNTKRLIYAYAPLKRFSEGLQRPYR